MSHTSRRNGQPILRPVTRWERLVTASRARWEARQREDQGVPTQARREPISPARRPARSSADPVIATPGVVRTGSLAYWRHKRLMKQRAAEARARAEAISRHIDETAPLTHYDQNL